MRHLRTLLGWLLEKSIEAEQTHREKDLLREIKSLEKVHGIHLTEQDDLRAQLTRREDDVRRLETEVDLLKREIEGMSAINSRALNWIENIRKAEEPKIPQEVLDHLLNNSSVPWTNS